MSKTLVTTFLALTAIAPALGQPSQLRTPGQMASLLGVPAMGCKGSAKYEVTFTGTWTAARHPGPVGTEPVPDALAHFSPVALTTHNGGYKMFAPRKFATVGVQSIAETGATAIMSQEVMDNCGANCGAFYATPCLDSSGFISNKCTSKVEVPVDSKMPYLSFLSMLAPSPDWFTGIDSYALCKDGEWMESSVLYPATYDAGTDSGETFQAIDKPSDPVTKIYKQIGSSSPLYNPEKGWVPPVATVTIKLIDLA